MWRLKLILVLVIMLWLNPHAMAGSYVGSEACAACHQQHYNDFRVSAHPFKIMRAELARHRGLPLPMGYHWDDISYVIGGAYKKVRYMNKQGYIITAGKRGEELKTQYNLETGTWSFYHKGEKKPYNCGRCHTTGFKKSGHQDGLPGIQGSWAAAGIQCEACHGPGAAHLKRPGKATIKVDRTAKACGKCHIRGDASLIPAKKGFIRHHEQYNELLASPHKAISCVTCHNPHKRAQFSIKKQCVACHNKQTKDYQGSSMQKVGVTCMDCHMPRATKSATAKSSVQGDIRTHLFSINRQAKSMFYTKQIKGKTKEFAKSFVSIDFACLQCHQDKDRAWASKMAKGVHGVGK